MTIKRPPMVSINLAWLGLKIETINDSSAQHADNLSMMCSVMAAILTLLGSMVLMQVILLTMVVNTS